ncbi:MAG: hypothetical protein IKI95_08380 [Clostridia bacterium]|nr:hypothetical protein [Clostridia bacterium]
MQFKLLNIHKFVGNFATTLVGTFIPLIIYNATGSLRLAVLFLFGQNLCRLLANHIFKKMYGRYPQLTLMLRVLPLLIYNISLIFLEDFLVLGIILVTISYGVNLSFKNNADGVLLNYTSKKKTGKNIVLTRVVESISAIVACVTGGLFIDWNQTALIIFSLSLYIVSVLPLFIYFFANKSKSGFNRDFTSNAAVEYDKDPALRQKRKSMVKTFILQYFLFYTIFCIIDPFTNMYTLHLFIDVPTFAKAGYLTAMFQVANLIGNLVVGLFAKKADLNTLNSIFGVVCALPLGIIPFIQNYAAVYALIFVFGFAYSICSFFMMDSLMVKSKFISATNKTLLARQDGIIVGQMITPVVVIIFNSVLPVFFLMVAALFVYSIYTNIVENKLRKKLVDYLENNEIE